VVADDFAVVDYAEGTKRTWRTLRLSEILQIHKFSLEPQLLSGFQDFVNVFL
jgi:hypothetical protein